MIDQKRLPRPAFGIPSVVSLADLPSAAELKARAREILCKALQTEGRYEQAAAYKVADEILEQLPGSRLDLLNIAGSNLTRTFKTPELWKALQECAAADGEGGLTTIELPYDSGFASGGEALISAIQCLPSLKYLNISSPWRGMDLSALRGLECVQVAGEPGPTITVAAGVQVQLRNLSRIDSKTMVIHVDEDGKQAGAPRPLGGRIFERRPQESELRDLQAAGLAPRDLNLNGKAAFPDTKAGPQLIGPIVCRHLAYQWCRDRQQYFQDATGERFHYRHYASVEAIASHVQPPVTDFSGGGAQAVFEASQFGSMVADELGCMQSGEVRHFMLLATTHAMGIELRFGRKSDGELSGHEFVVKVFDPTVTIVPQTTVVHDPAMLRGSSLRDWIPERLMSHYFPNFGGAAACPEIGAVCRIPAEAAPALRAGAQGRQEDQGWAKHVPTEARGTPEFLRWACFQGKKDAVKSTLDSIIEKTRRAPAKSGPLLQKLWVGVPGLYFAFMSGSPGTIDQYVRSIVEIDDGLLSWPNKHAILRAEVNSRSALETAFVMGRPQEIAAFTRSVLRHAARKEMPASVALGLLRAPAKDERGRPRPVLHHICATTKAFSLDPSTPLQRATAVFLYLGEILASPVLSSKQKKEFCESSAGPVFGKTAAAQAALEAGNPHMAAAMVCAVLEIGGGDKALLKSLGVSLKDVLSKLDEGPQGRQWHSRIVSSVEHSGLKPKDERPAQGDQKGECAAESVPAQLPRPSGSAVPQ